MKKILLLFLILSLGACNNAGSSNSNNSSQDSSRLSSTINQIERERVEDMKNNLLKLNYKVSSNTYSISQEDYYGISIEVEETGSATLYDDNFVVKEFEQKIGDSSVLGRIETGINDGNIYQITYYGENDTNNSVKNYIDNDKNRELIFDIGFVNEYVSNILDVTLAYLTNEENKIYLNTNFDEIDLSSDGEKKLQYRFISYAPNGKDKIEEVQRDDTLTITNGKITRVKTVMLYSLQDGVNSKYMEKDISFSYEKLVSFEGEKINPNNI